MKLHLFRLTKMIRKTIHWIRRLLEPRDYDAAKAYYHRQLHREMLNAKQPPVVIYQMGKVGSSSINRSLKVLRQDMPIFHVHYLTKDLIDLNEGMRIKFFRTKEEKELKRTWLCEFLNNQLAAGLINGNKWKIITLVRDPIARNVSAFFQTLKVEVLEPDYRYKFTAGSKSTYKFETIATLENFDELMESYLKDFDHKTPLEFFDREIKGVLDIDVFANDFPKQKGYKIYRGAVADMLLIRLESLNECSHEAFKEFLNIENFTLINTNIGDNKNYSSIYNKFKKNIVLTDSYISEMYESDFTRNFYTESEINQFKIRWCKEKSSTPL